MLAVALTAVALSGAAPVPVTGGTAVQRSVVRGLLAHADPGAVSFARIDGKRTLILGGARYRAPSERYGRALWEAQIVGAAAADILAARGESLAGYEVASGVLGIPYHGPPREQRLDLGAVKRLRQVILGKARSAGLTVTSARVLRLGRGALDVTVRLREDQLLDSSAAAALTRLFGAGTHFLAVEAPDGTAVAYGGEFEGGGGWNYGGDTGTSPVPRTVPPERLWRPRTHLVVQLSGGSPTGKTRTFHIDCGGSLPAVGSRCRRVLADRWALLVPTVNYPCPGTPFGWWVSVRGVLAGRSVSRDYSTCYGATGKRWARFLGA